MNEDAVEKWFIKADNDYKIASTNISSEEPVADMICFHAQQCIEKYLKGFLIFNDKDIDKTHNLSAILEKCMDIEKRFEQLAERKIDALTPYATVYRYPDDFYIPTIEEAHEALSAADFVRTFIRGLVGIEKE